MALNAILIEVLRVSAKSGVQPCEKEGWAGGARRERSCCSLALQFASCQSVFNIGSELVKCCTTRNAKNMQIAATSTMWGGGKRKVLGGRRVPAAIKLVSVLEI